jgi:membrane associated rhomboid family serine protease
MGANFALPGWYYLTPLTSVFLHGGWMHLIGNMLYLWIFGNNIEDYFGPVKFLIFYLFAGLASVALFALFNLGSDIPLVGASGAIAGVMGAYIVLHPRARITVLIVLLFIFFRDFSAKLVLGIWFFYQLVMWLVGSTTGSGIAFLAHIGGFVFGYAILWLVLKIKGGGPRDQDYRLYWRH